MTDKRSHSHRRWAMLAVSVTGVPCEHEAIPRRRQIGRPPS